MAPGKSTLGFICGPHVFAIYLSLKFSLIFLLTKTILLKFSFSWYEKKKEFREKPAVSAKVQYIKLLQLHASQGSVSPLSR